MCRIEGKTCFEVHYQLGTTQVNQLTFSWMPPILSLPSLRLDRDNSAYASSYSYPRPWNPYKLEIRITINDIIRYKSFSGWHTSLIIREINQIKGNKSLNSKYRTFYECTIYAIYTHVSDIHPLKLSYLVMIIGDECPVCHLHVVTIAIHFTYFS